MSFLLAKISFLMQKRAATSKSNLISLDVSTHEDVFLNLLLHELLGAQRCISSVFATHVQCKYMGMLIFLFFGSSRKSGRESSMRVVTFSD